MCMAACNVTIVTLSRQMWRYKSKCIRIIPDGICHSDLSSNFRGHGDVLVGFFFFGGGGGGAGFGFQGTYFLIHCSNH